MSWIERLGNLPLFEQYDFQGGQICSAGSDPLAVRNERIKSALAAALDTHFSSKGADPHLLHAHLMKIGKQVGERSLVSALWARCASENFQIGFSRESARRVVPCDGKLSVKGRIFSFHWCLVRGLRPLSPYLEKKLYHAREQVLHSPNTTAAVALAFLRYLYEGTLPDSKSTLHILERKWLVSEEMRARIKAHRVSLLFLKRFEKAARDLPLIQRSEEAAPVAALAPISGVEEIEIRVGKYTLAASRSKLCSKSAWMREKLHRREGARQDLTLPDEEANAFLRDYVRFLSRDEDFDEGALLRYLHRGNAKLLVGLCRKDGILLNSALVFEYEPPELEEFIRIREALPEPRPLPERSAPIPDRILKVRGGFLFINCRQLALRSPVFQDLDRPLLKLFAHVPIRFVERWIALLLQGRWDNAYQRPREKPPFPMSAEVAELPDKSLMALYALLQHEGAYPHCWPWFDTRMWKADLPLLPELTLRTLSLNARGPGVTLVEFQRLLQRPALLKSVEKLTLHYVSSDFREALSEWARSRTPLKEIEVEGAHLSLLPEGWSALIPREPNTEVPPGKIEQEELINRAPDLRTLDFPETEGEEPFDLRPWNGRPWSIERLTLNGSQIKNVFHLSSAPKVRELSLREVETPVVQAAHFKALFQVGPNLQKFSLHLCEANREELVFAFYEFLQGCPELRSLTLSGNAWAGEFLFDLLTECCPRLEELQIECLSGEISSDALPKLAKACPNLRSLKLKSLELKTWEEVVQSLEHLSELEELEVHVLEGSGTLTERALAALKPLKTLSITGNHGLSEKKWRTIVQKTAHLMVLRLEMPHRPMMSSILCHCPYLRELELNGEKNYYVPSLPGAP